MTSNAEISLFVVLNDKGTYYGGFDAENKSAIYVEDPRHAKIFSNKYDARLRPDESLVEMIVDLESAEVEYSDPFRPRRRVQHNPKAHSNG